MKKSFLALSIITAFTISYADYLIKTPLEANNGGSLPSNSIVFKNLAKWNPHEQIVSEWVDVNGIYDCLNWVPNENTVYVGEALEQTTDDCKQLQERTVQNQEISSTGEVRALGSSFTETQNYVVSGIRDTIGTSIGWVAFADAKSLPKGWDVLRWSSKSLTNIPKGQYPLISANMIELNNNQLDNVDGLINLTSVSFLLINDNNINNIEGLSSLKSGHTLFISNNQLTNVDGLSGLTSLDSLYMNNNQITNVGGLSGLTSLNTLSIDNNQLTNVDGLNVLTSVNRLYLGSNHLANISGLSNLTSVNILDLADNKLMNISGLSNMRVGSSINIDKSSASYTYAKLAATTIFCTENNASKFQGSAQKTDVCESP